MPRSTTDATRFTSTAPHASSKFTGFNPSNGPRSTSIPLPSNAPAGETPQQKIARLREAAWRAKAGQQQGTTFDRIVAGGRVWADRAHRVTAYGLIGFTGIAAVITAVSLTDMILYNRRKRREWYAEKSAEREQSIAAARQALSQGTANEDQILLLNQESAAQEAALAKRNRPGMFKRATNFVFGGLSNEDVGAGDRLERVEEKGRGIVEQVKEKSQQAAEKARSGFLAAEESTQETGQGLGIMRAVGEVKNKGERAVDKVKSEVVWTESQVAGGPLDRIAEEAMQKAKQTEKSWANWIRGR